jgi:hypothetical protein
MTSVAFTMASTSSPICILSSSVDSRVIKAVTVAGIFNSILIIAVTSPFCTAITLPLRWFLALIFKLKTSNQKKMLGNLRFLMMRQI